ncbi:uncharacterized protein BO95DRAFT_447085 [Aspergillus brunneoviolaceus CBS 621.78]|uniref:Uncharacterized protein n=1 Tax=Aspergillus brunneoviolaceus CBS 621.78 TaxID=1450534 RepID=A0ACD1FWD5_9EURO|nr:hypothetical protein BO95DRAFT_447085 [Aspergillus brunneoviolaceus CBS 621.78]RAH41287.1 hypothetical protein BO95DRAFT_447085 [Aspergillus brunneoviolaceus CBS 621.78]
MCNYVQNYYIYTACYSPNSHFLRTEMEGIKDNSSRCGKAPHERFIIVPEKCTLCIKEGK